MTTQYIITDSRYTVSNADTGCPNSNSWREGIYSIIDRFGVDRTPGSGNTEHHGYNGLRRATMFGGCTKTEIPPSAPVDVKCKLGPHSVYGQLLRPWEPGDDLVLLSKLAGKIRGHDWNAGIFIGELGKTVDMMASRTKSIARAALALKKGDVAKALKYLSQDPISSKKKRRLEQMSWEQAWLELRYGWRPALNDIWELSKAIQQLSVPREKKFVARHFIGYEPKCTIDIYKMVGTGRFCKQIIAYLAEEQPALADHLGLTNPGSVAWELVPFSFVADWFIPIGNYINTQATLSKLQGRFIKTTYAWYKFDVNDIQEVFKKPHQLPYTSDFYYGGLRPFGTRYYYVYREPTVTLPVPLPSFKGYDAIKGASPLSRLLDAASLLSVVFTGKPVRVRYS